MEFFNFTNEPSYHFFQWLIYSGQVDVDALLHKTLADVKASELVEIDLATSLLARENLRRQLADLFGQHQQVWYGKQGLDLDRYTVEACLVSNDYAEADALFVGLLEHAAASVSFGAVAEALLRRAGKWAPSSG
jgi:hypothetical protein